MQPRRSSSARWTHGVALQDRGPGESYRPDDVAPSLLGAHQPGIATPVLDHVAFAALDVSVERAPDLRDLLSALTVEAERLMRAEHRADAAQGPAGALTITLGLGPALFDGRFGLASQRPVGLTELPAFPGDALDPASCGGELCIQACADALPKAGGALASLVAVADGAARVRWSQRGSMCAWRASAPAGVHATCWASRRRRATRAAARTSTATSGSAAASAAGWSAARCSSCVGSGSCWTPGAACPSPSRNG